MSVAAVGDGAELGAPARSAMAIRVRGLTRSFPGRDALRGLSFEVASGACHALFGHNGSGKTTLLRILATLLSPTKGEVEIAGCRLPRESGAARAKLGLVLDHCVLPRELRLGEALRYYADLYGVDRAPDRIETLAARLGLARRLRDPVRALSRGMTRRAGMIRALLHGPEVLLLDEPFAGLDPGVAGRLAAFLAELRDGGTTVLLVTHDLARGASLAQTAALLEHGRLRVQGPVADVVREAEGALAAEAAS